MPLLVSVKRIKLVRLANEPNVLPVKPVIAKFVRVEVNSEDCAAADILRPELKLRMRNVEEKS